MSVLLKPHASVTAGAVSGRFYLGDCVEVFAHLPAQSVDVIVTSPPYNLGIQYNRYQDSLSREDYLAWTHAWVGAAMRVLRPDGSMFLNVGAKPTDPWTALDVAQAVRPHLKLQNIIHWIKSIAIDRNSAGAAAGLNRDLAVGHYKPINSDRFLNDCHEFIFHFTPHGSTELDRLALGVPLPGPVERRALEECQPGPALPRQYVVHSLRNDSAARSRPPPPGDVPLAAARAVSAVARPQPRSGCDGPVRRPRQHRGGVCAPRHQFHRRRHRRGVFEGRPRRGCRKPRARGSRKQR
jgi:hypothetical protein